MKKKILFLLALPTLFFACSSDEVSETGQGGTETPTTPTEEVAVVQNVVLNENTLMSIGDLSVTEGASTRAWEDIEGNAAKFWLNVPNEVLEGIDYEIVADDFAIRKNGKYIDDLTVDEFVPNSPIYAEYGEKVFIKNNGNLGIGVEGLENLNWGTNNENPEYTFEVWLWVNNEKDELKDDGSGLYEKVPLFNADMQNKWIGEEDIDKDGNIIPGEDITKDVTQYGLQRTAADGGNGYYSVRYNVYRGISGKVVEGSGLLYGDSPYIKVSISVRRTDVLTGVDGKDQNIIKPVYPTDSNSAPHKSLSKDSSDILSVK